MEVKFYKMTGLGNDYVYLDCLENKLNIDFSEFAKQVSRRNFSVGSDGLVVMLPSMLADVRMRIFNSDGSEAEICGNALRCLAKFMYDKTGKKKLVIATKKKLVRTTILESTKNMADVCVEMGEVVRLEPFKEQVLGRELELNPMNVGNPHCVVFVKNFDFDIEKYGSEIAKLFEEGSNVEFVKIMQEGQLRVRVFERGSGVTLACGSGACASAMCYVDKFKQQNKKVQVLLDGGKLNIDCSNSQNVIMTGSANFVFSGDIEIDKEC